MEKEPNLLDLLKSGKLPEIEVSMTHETYLLAFLTAVAVIVVAKIVSKL